MSFDSEKPVGRLRSTGKGAADFQQDPLYEFRLDCALRFESLPLRPELDDAMSESVVGRRIRYEQEVPVVLEKGDYPSELSDAFYFSDTPTIEHTSLDLTRDAEGRQFIEGSFTIGPTTFKVNPAFPGIEISTDNAEGGTLSYKTSNETLLKLLAAMFARTAAHLLEQLHKESLKLNEERVRKDGAEAQLLQVPFSKPTDTDIQLVIKGLVEDGSWENVSELLQRLAEETGKTTFTTKALFAPQIDSDISIAADRSLLVTKVETYHGSLEEQEVTLNLNWYVFESNTELTGVATQNHNEDMNTPVSNATVKPTNYDIESYAFMKDLEFITGGNTDGKKYSVADPEWLTLVSVFMTTIDPHLKKYSSDSAF